MSCALQAIKFTLVHESAVLPLSAYGGLLAGASPAAGAPPALLIPQRLEGARCRQLLQLLAAAAGPRGAEQAPAPAPPPLAAADADAPAKVGTVRGVWRFSIDESFICCLWCLGWGRGTVQAPHYLHEPLLPGS